MLGSNLALSARDRFETVAAHHQHELLFSGCENLAADITDRSDIEKAVKRVGPDAVVHCAAETRVDFCEQHPDAAFLVNSEGAKNVASACAKVGASLIYISTDSIFDGAKGMYSEQDEPNPINVYAASKLEGERAVKASLDRCLIIRTNFYGWSLGESKSLAQWMLDRMNRGIEVPGFTDIFFSPLVTSRLSELLIDLIAKDVTGLFHLGAAEKVSKYRFGTLLANVFGNAEEMVVPTTSEDSAFIAPRPKDTSLSPASIEATLHRKMPSIKDDLQLLKNLLQSGYTETLKEQIVRSGGRS